MSNRIKRKIFFLILSNFALGLVAAVDLLLLNEIVKITSQPLGLALLLAIYALSILLYLSVGFIDYRVYKLGLEKGILFKGEEA